MSEAGERAVARDTGGALLSATSETAGNAPPAPRTRDRKRGRPRIFVSNLPPAAPAPWYGRTRACRWCSATVVRRVERQDGSAFIRVAHEATCKAAA